MKNIPPVFLLYGYLCAALLIQGCAAGSGNPWATLNSQADSSDGFVTFQTKLNVSGADDRARLYAELRAMDSHAKGESFYVSDDPELLQVKPGKYELFLSHITVDPRRHTGTKKQIYILQASEPFFVKPGEVINLGAIHFEVGKSPSLPASTVGYCFDAFDENQEIVIGEKLKIAFCIIDNSGVIHGLFADAGVHAAIQQNVLQRFATTNHFGKKKMLKRQVV